MIRKCYAASLKNCKGPMSQEHYISDCLLPEKVTFWGGVKFPKIVIPKGSATAKILCQFHNSLLSPFDSEACLLLEAINYPEKYEGLSQEQRDTHGIINFEINGDKLEKWLMKTTINHLFQIDRNYMDQAEACLDYLFNGRCFSKPSGIYGFKQMNWIPNKGYMLFPLIGINGLCTGLLFFINNFPFVFFNNLHHGLPFAIMDWKPDGVDEEFHHYLFDLHRQIITGNIEYRPHTLDIFLDQKTKIMFVR